jgi:hypothetical protein
MGRQFYFDRTGGTDGYFGHWAPGGTSSARVQETCCLNCKDKQREILMLRAALKRALEGREMP